MSEGTSRYIRHKDVAYTDPDSNYQGKLQIATQTAGKALLLIERPGRHQLWIEIRADDLWDLAETAKAGSLRSRYLRADGGCIHAQATSDAASLRIGISRVEGVAVMVVSKEDLWNAAFFIKTGQTLDGTWKDLGTQSLS